MPVRTARNLNTIITALVIFSLLITPLEPSRRVSAAPAPASDLRPFAAVVDGDVTLSMSDSLQSDLNSNGLVDPGDTIRYTITAANHGADDAANVRVEDLLDSALALAPGSLSTTPLAYAAAQTVLEDGFASLTLAASDADGDELAYEITTPPAHGSLTGAAPDMLYTPTTDYNGADAFTYQACDDDGNCASADVSITVTPVNDAPAFTAGAGQSVLEDSGAASVPGWATAISAGPTNESGQVTAFSVTNTNNGLFSAQPAVSSATGALTFTPAANANGSAQVTVTLSDDGGAANGGASSSAATFTIQVIAVNDAPTFTPGVNVSVSADSGENTFSGWASAISAGPANESAQGLGFTVTVTSNPALFAVAPSVSAATGDLTFSLAAGETGAANVELYLQDDAGTANGGVNRSSTASFTITSTDVNDPPTLANQSVSIPENSPAGTPVAVVAADDPDAGQTHTYSITAGNASGAFAIDADTGAISVADPSRLDYETPALNSYSLTVQALDNGSPALTGSATIAVSVTDINEAPQAGGGPLTVLEDGSVPFTLTHSDPEGDALTYGITAAPSNGALSGTAPDLTYTPAANYNGSDAFTFQVCDPSSSCNSAVVSISVTAVNDAPGFTPGADQTVLEDAAAVTVAGWATAISAGAADESGQTLTFDLSNTNNSLFSAQPALTSAGALTFTPAANANGSAVVTVTLRDNGGTANGGADSSSPATFTITVTAVNDAPAFTPGADQTVLEDAAAVTVAGWATAISAGPGDESGQALNFSLTNTNNGLFSAQPALTTAGALSFTPAANANGSAQVTVTLSDDGGTANGGASSSAATFTISVTAVNDPPTLADQSVSIAENSANSTAVTTAAAADPDAGQTHTYSITAGNASGAFAIDASTGAISVADSSKLDYETPALASYSLTVQVLDNGSPALNGSATIAVSVTDVNEVPVVTGESYQAIANTLLEVRSASSAASPRVFAAGSLIANDSDPEGTAISAALVSATPGAQVTVNADGSFTYLNAASAAASDTFTYRVSDESGLSSEAVVTISFSGRVWYVKNDAAAGGGGRSVDPFDTLLEAQTASAAGDTIFVYAGSGATTGQNAGITLKANQRLLGEAAGLSFDLALNGNAAPLALLNPTGARPHIENSAAGSAAVTINASAEVRGLEISGTASAVNAAFAVTGSLTLADNSLHAPSSNALVVAASGGILTADVSGNTFSQAAGGLNASTSGAGVLRLAYSANAHATTGPAAQISTGAVTITGFSDNIVNSGSGFVVSNALFDAAPATPAYDTLDFGASVLGSSGSPLSGAGLLFTSVRGDLSLNGLAAYTSGGAALSASGPGTVYNAAGGAGLRLSANNAMLSAVGAPAVQLTNLTVNVPSATVTSINSPSNGLAFTGGSGVFTAGAASAISGSTSQAVLLDSSDGLTFTYAGALVNTTGRAVTAQYSDGSSVTFSGALNCSNACRGIYLNSNTGSAFRFTGGVNLAAGSASTNAAFYVSNSGTVSVTGSANILNAVNIAALQILNTNIAAEGITFQSISASGAAGGITLLSTGGAGGLTVTGVGTTPGSGGAIQNMTGDGISLTGAANTTLKYMTLTNTATSTTGASCTQISATDCASGVDLVSSSNIVLTGVVVNGSGQMGLSASSVAGLTLTGVSIQNAGNSDDEYAVLLHNPTGQVRLTNTTLTNMWETGLRLYKSDSTPLHMTLDTVTITTTRDTITGEDGFQFQLANSAVAYVDVNNSTFASLLRDSIDGMYTGSSTLHLTVRGSGFTNSAGSGGITVGGSGAGNGYLTIANNTQTVGASGLPVSLTSMENATLNAQVESNSMGYTGGTQYSQGMRLSQEDASTMTVLLNNNHITGQGYEALTAFARQVGAASGGSLHLTATNNVASTPALAGSYGMSIAAQSGGNGICLNASGNTFYGSSGQAGIRARVETAAESFALVGWSGTAEATLQTRNPASSPDAVALGAGTFTSAASCRTAQGASLPSAALGGPATLASAGRGRALGRPIPAPVIRPAAQSGGETVQVTIGTLPAGASVTIVFDVRLSADLSPTVELISNQASLYADGLTTVLSDDPATAATPDDATTTVVNSTPRAVDDVYALVEDQAFTTAAAGGLLNNDLAAAGRTLSAVVVSGPAAGSLTLNVDGSFTYTPNPDSNGADTFTYKSMDGTGESAPALVTLNVSPRNDAPVLDALGDMRLAEFVQGSANPGTRIVDLLATSAGVSDVDAGALSGVAISGLGAVAGSHWEYTLDNVTWYAAGSPSETAALLLAADGNTRIRFVPPVSYVGVLDPAMTVRAWDRTTGTNGGLVDLTTGAGGETAFSAASDTASVQVLVGADLALAQSVSANPAVAGTQITFSLTITNNSLVQAEGVRIVDTLPAGASFVSASSGCAHAAGTVTCSLGILGGGASRVATITAAIPTDAEGALTNAAGVSADTGDPDPANNSSSLEVQVAKELQVVDPTDLFSAGWLETPPTQQPQCGSIFLGEFGNQTVSSRLTDLPPHNYVTVEFDLHILRSWEGSMTVVDGDAIGPDTWRLAADGRTLLHTTFSNVDWKPYYQAYPGMFWAELRNAPRTGAAAINSLCYTYNGSPLDSTYHLVFGFEHEGGSLALDFSAAGLQDLADESWGLSNINVSVDAQQRYKYYWPLFR